MLLRLNEEEKAEIFQLIYAALPTHSTVQSRLCATRTVFQLPEGGGNRSVVDT